MDRKLGQTRALKNSIDKLKANKMMLLLIMILIVILALPSVSAAGKGIAASVITLLLVKAESRQQPRGVILLAVALSAVTILCIMNGSRLPPVCEWVVVALFVPLIVSQWLFGITE